MDATESFPLVFDTVHKFKFSEQIWLKSYIHELYRVSHKQKSCMCDDK